MRFDHSCHPCDVTMVILPAKFLQQSNFANELWSPCGSPANFGHYRGPRMASFPLSEDVLALPARESHREEVRLM